MLRCGSLRLPVALSLVLALASCVSPATRAETGTLSRIDLDVSGTGAEVFRIPALAVTNRGTLVASYDARPSMADVPSNIALVVRRSTDGGRTWLARQVVRAGPAPQGFGDPSLLVDRQTGRIFLFHAASINQGFAGSHTGSDHDDPDVLQADYSWSDDDGVTWQHRRITSSIKDPAWGGLFAASGEGIQLQHGQFAGRLIQQYVVRFNGANWAGSAFSDDHGATWAMGALAGPGLDENKTVELRDGTVMLNSRARPYRRVARSMDGGVTYSDPRDDSTLVDPGNNGAIVRLDPAASPGDPRAAWLLFSNTASTTTRERLTVRMSCDDGATWTIARVIEPGAAAYSTLTPLPDGRIGVLYERGEYEAITFAAFDLEWLGGDGCRAR